MKDKIAYYQEWNKSHREYKKIWAWNKRHNKINPISSGIQKPFVPRIIELPEHSTGSKRKCCWCGNNPEAGFCSKSCQREAKKFGTKDIKLITPEFAESLMGA